MKNYEEIEWCNMRWFRPKSRNKRVLLIGDSITLGYSEFVKCELEDVADIAYLATSKAVDADAYVDEIRYVIKDYKVDVIHFNNGLHGWHMTPEQYGINLENVISMIKKVAPYTQVIWGTSTQCYEDAYPERTKQIEERNRVSVRLMEKHNIPVNHLYEITECRKDLLSDGIHYAEEGYRLLGKKVAEMVRKFL